MMKKEEQLSFQKLSMELRKRFEKLEKNFPVDVDKKDPEVLKKNNEIFLEMLDRWLKRE